MKYIPAAYWVVEDRDRAVIDGKRYSVYCSCGWHDVRYYMRSSAGNAGKYHCEKEHSGGAVRIRYALC